MMRAGNGAAAAVLASAVAIMTMATAVPAAAAVEYVRLCDETVYGPGFHYLPGTDTCVNETTHLAKIDTAGGIWNWRIPNNPRQYVKKPKKACKGELIEFGEVTSAGLIYNDLTTRFESTTRVPLTLQANEYVSAVIYEGGFTTAGAGNFCTYYYYEDATLGPVYTPLGCLDTLALGNTGATAFFVPDATRPPDTVNPISIAAASGERASTNVFDPPIPNPADVHGSVSIYLCVQKGS